MIWYADMTSEGLYGLVSLELRQSGRSWRPVDDGVMTPVSNVVIGVFAVVGVVTLLAFLYYLHSNNRLLICISFVNFIG